MSDPADAERFLDWRVENGSDLIKIIAEDPAATEAPALSHGWRNRAPSSLRRS